jgi:hypothetical protein
VWTESSQLPKAAAWLTTSLDPLLVCRPTNPCGARFLRRVLSCLFLFVAGCSTSIFCRPSLAQGPWPCDASRQATALCVYLPRKEVPGENLAGDQACANCHAQKSATYRGTPMANALALPVPGKLLHSGGMAISLGRYSYQIFADGMQWLYKVSGSEQTQTEPILYVFGVGRVAQTYVFRHNGRLYESRVSFYPAIDGLDWTVGDKLDSAPSVEDAAGRDISGDEARNCFSCHATSSVHGSKLDLNAMSPGVGCESCHGPGERHSQAMLVEPASSGDSLIFNPRTLDPERLSQDFCGACHRGVDAVAVMPDLGGINNVRFQPYRLYNSRGHDPTDGHFACTVCHDPHSDLQKSLAFYDSKCTNCHIDGNRSGSKRPAASPCPVSAADCVSCHMPKVLLPAAHFQFTDHRIRIVRAREPYPF